MDDKKILTINKDEMQQMIKNIISEGSYLFYEIEDIQDNFDIFNGYTTLNYTKKISPLFSEKAILANKNILNLIFEETPFYFIEVDGDPVDKNGFNFDRIFPSTRDIGINNVASPLQIPFWEVLFRESFGSIYNDLLLNIYNKLKYPFIGENQYLNAGLFPKLSNYYFNNDEENINKDNIRLTFRNSAKNNFEDIKNAIEEDAIKFVEDNKSNFKNIESFLDLEEGAQNDLYNPNDGNSNITQKGIKNYLRKKNEYKGCLDCLNDIVDAKLNSVYSILNYHPHHSNFIDTWIESLKNSGKINENDLDKERKIYKLQDIKYELLKRKFAGSTTLYKLCLSSINRRGSLLKTISTGDVYIDNLSNNFRDIRPLRLINSPGVLTSVSNRSKLGITPYETYYLNAKNDINMPKLPIGIVTPLYYSTSNRVINRKVNEIKYSAENFYLDKYEENRKALLRDSSNILDISNPVSPKSATSFKSAYTRLDQAIDIPDNIDNEKEYRKLDREIEINIPGRQTIKYDMNKLDIKIPMIDSSSINGVVLDMTLDTILYHKNSFQKTLNNNKYNYVTYPLSDNASLSLQDMDWLSFLQENTEEKSRVQDNIKFGSQISYYSKFSQMPGTNHMFFAISYGDDNIPDKTEIKQNDKVVNMTLEDYLYNRKGDDSYSIKNNWVAPKNFMELNKNTFSYDEWISIKGTQPKYAYLWMYTFEYNNYSYKIYPSNIKISLISKIALKLNGNNSYNTELLNLNGIIDKYNKDSTINLINTHMGVLPFTYPNMRDNLLLFTNIGPQEIIENGKLIGYKEIDDLNLNEYAPAIFAFSNYDLVNLTNHNSNTINYENKITEFPNSDTKSIFYGITNTKVDDDTNEVKIDTKWSSPIKVINLSHDLYRKLSNVKLLTSSNNDVYFPDWSNLVYHLNPYLNNNMESATPLRGKEVIGPTNREENTLLNSSKPLCNLLRFRNKDYLCNDNGEVKNPYLTPTIKYSGIGMYLDHIHNENRPTFNKEKPTYIDVFGDNRFPDYYDTMNGDTRSTYFKDTLTEKDCLKFQFSPIQINYPNIHDILKNPNDLNNNLKNPDLILALDDINLNYFKLAPMSLSNNPEDKFEWTWAGTWKDENGIDQYDPTIKNLTYKNNKWSIDDNYFYEAGMSLNDKMKKVDEWISITKNEQDAVNIKNKIRKAYNDAIDKNYKKHTSKNIAKWNKWCWNTKKDSFTICGTIDIFSEDLKRSISDSPLNRDTWHIIGRENEFSFDLYIRSNKNNTSYIITPTFIVGNPTSTKAYTLEDNPITISGDDIVINTLKDSRKEIRFAISSKIINNTKNNSMLLSIVINDKIKQSLKILNNSNEEITFKSLNLGIDIGSRQISAIDIYHNYNKDKPKKSIIQKDIFRGNIYDLRLYTRSFSELELILLQAGSLRELYSYSPSVYKLGYNIYRDLGIIKFYKKLNENELLPNISKIRVFSRSVWDSILPDLYPISDEENLSTSPEYTPDAKNPIGDKDIFIRDENNNIRLNNAVQQPLMESVEVINNSKSIQNDNIDSKPVIYYNNPALVPVTKFRNTIENKLSDDPRYNTIGEQDYITMINTMVQPIYYSNTDFRSGAILVKKNIKNENDNCVVTVGTSNLNSINIPIDVENGSFKYTASLNPNFIVDISSDLSAGIVSDGSDCFLSRIDDTIKNRIMYYKEIPTGSLLNANIISTFTIPEQKTAYKNKISLTGRLNKLYAEGIILDGNFAEFLKTNNYYTEYLIPVKSENNTNSHYIYKWHAIRTLKEGVYYFTYKYPIQFLPFSELDCGTTSNGQFFTTYYATVRLKVEVKGTPLPYDSKYNTIIEGNSSSSGSKAYLPEEIENTLKSESFFISQDNRTYPHRKININLYVMDSITNNSQSNSTSYVWNLIGTNNPETLNTIIQDVFGCPLIDLRHINNKNKDFSILNKIPMIFSRNFTGPFFTAKKIKDHYEPKTVVPDIFPPINVNPFNTKNKKDILNSYEKQSMTAGRSYRLLFNYDASLGEMSYNNSEFLINQNLNKNQYIIKDEEFKEYARNFNLSESGVDDRFVNAKEYMYLPDESSSNIFRNNDILPVGININGKEYTNSNIISNYSGYLTNNGGWVSYESKYNGHTIFALGDPYSKCRYNNIALNKSSYYDISNMCTFPYAPENINLDNKENIPCTYLNRHKYIPLIKSSGIFIPDMNFIIDNFDEYKILYNICKAKSEYIQTHIISHMITTAKSNPGIFKGISKLSPCVDYFNSNGAPVKNVDKYSIITSYNHKLYAYKTNNQEIGIKDNNVNIEYRLPYSNNIIKTQNYNNNNYWTTNSENRYICDVEEERDVFEFEVPAEGLTLTYNLESEISSQMEFAIIVKSNSTIENENINISFMDKNKNIIKSNLSLTDSKEKYGKNKSYTIYSREYNPNNNAFQYINFNIKLEENPTKINTINIAKIIVRNSKSNSHKYALKYGMYLNEDSPESNNVVVKIPGITRIVYAQNNFNRMHSFIPVNLHRVATTIKSNKGEIKTTSGLSTNDSSIGNFFNKYKKKSVDLNQVQENTLIELTSPWLRILKIEEKKTKNGNELVASIHKYDYDKSPLEINTNPDNSLYNNNDLKVSPVEGAEGLQIGINSLSVKVTKDPVSNMYFVPIPGEYDSLNLMLNVTDGENLMNNFTPISIFDEKLSGLSNCIHEENFNQINKSSPVLVTNIQLLTETEDNKDEIVCELEYLPIIYDEAKHHLSLNIIFHKTIG